MEHELEEIYDILGDSLSGLSDESKEEIIKKVKNSQSNR